VLEVGCHHGLHSVYLGRLVGPDGTVVAVEAEPGNALIAQAQLQLNGLDRCLVVAAAAGAQPGTVRISLVDNIISGAGVADELIEVPVVTGDELDRRHGPFTMMKVDVEGYEAKVLRGCAAIIKRRPRLALELHGPLLHHAGDRVEEVQAILAEVGYQGTVMLPTLEMIAYEPARLPALCRDHAKVNLFLTPA
jgi:FkbM family methyltransferase